MSYCEASESRKAKLAAQVGKPAQKWKLPQVLNDSVNLSDLRGNSVLLKFMFPHCEAALLQFLRSTKFKKIL